MAVSYSLSSAYVGISIATLAFVRQRGDGIFFARLVHALSMSGWVMGAGISILFAVRDQFGSYRNLYCMIPLDKYDKFAIGLVSYAAFMLRSGEDMGGRQSIVPLVCYLPAR
jgi:hypothetical protein